MEKIFVGIDWATKEHQVCAIDNTGQILGERAFAHSGAGIDALYAWLLELAGGHRERLQVAIETPHGAVVETFLERGVAIHAINPKQLDRFRDRFTMAGAKDDRRDAHVLGDSLRTDGHCFRRLVVDEPAVIELREWSRMVEDLQQERVRLGNRVREQLRRYYPQFLELGDDVAGDWFLSLWELLPTPSAASRVAESEVAPILKKHRLRRLDAEKVLAITRQQPVTVAPGTTEAATAHIRVVAAQLRLINEQIKQAHHRLDELCAALSAPSQDDEQGQRCEQRDVEILDSLPGIGRIVLATLLAEASQPLKARDYHALRALSGAAPVTRRSGKRCVVVMRYACHGRLRNALYHWSRVAVQKDPTSNARYAALRKRGKSHGRALRTVGDRLLSVACAMLRNQTRYDPLHRVTAIERSFDAD